ncbi:MAG: alpha/beta hydrolase [Candidatus Dormiibacterota bacterium]
MKSTNFEVGSGDHRLAGWQAGSGPALVVLHGGPGLSEYTESLLPELTDRYTVIRYQQRGLAPSTTEGPFDVETQVADTVSILDELGLDRAVIIGHSWGGHLLMHLMASHPDRVAAGLVIDPLGAIGDGGEADLGRILGERTTPEAAARAAELDEKALRGEGTAADAIEGLALVWPGYFPDPSSAPPMPAMEMSLAAYAETMASCREHFERQTLVSLLPKTHVPALFLLGEQSPIPPAHGVASAALMPDAKVTVLPNCGHFVWLDQPGSVRLGVDSLYARITPARS